MKRYVALLFMLVLALVFCGCGTASETPTEPVVTEAPTETPTPTETVADDFSEEQDTPVLISYFITVLDENAQPVVGVAIRLGDSEEACLTDETGVAQFAMPEGEYVANIDELPMGYEFMTDYREFPFEAGNVTLVIQVRQTFSEPDDMGMEEEDLPVEELPEEEFVPEG